MILASLISGRCLNAVMAIAPASFPGGKCRLLRWQIFTQHQNGKVIARFSARLCLALFNYQSAERK